MRARVRNYTGQEVSGVRIRHFCDGKTETQALQGATPYTGHHKVAAVRSDGFLATDYSATWISKHTPATAKFRDNLSAVYCAVFDGLQAGHNGEPMPKWKFVPKYATQTLPITTNSLQLQHMTVTAYTSSSGSARANTNFYDLKNEMTNPFLLKIKDQKAMSLVSLAESKQTLSLVRSLSKDVSDAILFVAKGIYKPKTIIDAYIKYAKKNGLRDPRTYPGLPSRHKKFVKRMNAYYRNRPKQFHDLKQGIPNTAAERWLQYRYGIGPLLGDMGAAHDYVYTKWHKFIHFNKIVVKYKGGRTRPVTFSTSQVLITGESVSLAQYIGRYVIRNQVARHAIKTGFSPTELLATAWELVPFSFVVDWAYNLGDYFNALSATVGLTHIQTSFSIKEVVTASVRCIMGKTQGVIDTPSGPDGECEYGGFIRQTYASFPTPQPPSIKFPFDSFIDKRLFDSIALLKVGFNSKQLSNRGA